MEDGHVYINTPFIYHHHHPKRKKKKKGAFDGVVGDGPWDHEANKQKRVTWKKKVPRNQNTRKSVFLLFFLFF